MNKQPFKPPAYQETAFNCPYCNAYSNQLWSTLICSNTRSTLRDTEIAFCSHCKNYSIWHEEKMIFPDMSGIELPNEDLNKDIAEDYNEASSILNKSPRGAAALLRLALQKLCKQMGEKGEDINTDIGNLVRKGLSSVIQQSLDALRVIGNESVHPGQIDLRDDPKTAMSLFRLVNKIAETMITEPRQIKDIYDKIPEEKKKAIDKRDSKAKSKNPKT